MDMTMEESVELGFWVLGCWYGCMGGKEEWEVEEARVLTSSLEACNRGIVGRDRPLWCMYVMLHRYPIP